ncbi:MAG: hypothetical protein H6739_06915 [Alphaproteobacteria bacterium]|nr:hypothetical protein [Alphaproteobacteria bacterium]
MSSSSSRRRAREAGARRKAISRAQAMSAKQVHGFVDELFGEDLHAKRVGTLADGTLGVLHAASLGIHAIGRGLASAKGLSGQHAVKRVDRCIGNEAHRRGAAARPGW